MRRILGLLIALSLASAVTCVEPDVVGAVPGTPNVIPCEKTFGEALLFSQFRSFGNGRSPQMRFGIPKSGTLVASSAHLQGGWTPGMNVIDFTYNRATNRLTSYMRNALGQEWVWYYENVSGGLAFLGHAKTVDDLNALLVTVSNRDEGTTANLRNVTIDGAALDADPSTPTVDDFLATPAPQRNQWTVAGLDFSGGFDLHANLEIGGTFGTSPDLSSVIFKFGYLEPSTPALSVSGGAAIEGSGQPVPFRVGVNGAVLSQISVDYQTLDGSATQPDDYTAMSGTLTFQPCGATSQAFNVGVTGDALPESLERMSVGLSNPLGATIATATAVGTITEAASDISLSVGDVMISEGAAGTSRVRLPVVLNHALATPVAVQLQVVGGTATPGSDYFNQGPRTLSISPGNTSAYFEVKVAGDTVVEGDETAAGVLFNAIGASIGDSVGVLTIQDDDSPSTAAVQAYVSDASVAEGDSGPRYVYFTIALNRGASGRVLVNYQTVAGTASDGQDFRGRAGQVVLGRSKRSVTVSVMLLPDVIDEVDESFNLEVVSVVGPAVIGADPNGTATIVDDDLP